MDKGGGEKELVLSTQQIVSRNSDLVDEQNNNIRIEMHSNACEEE